MDNLAGKHIKGYDIQERIAAGGFGAVYKAYQSTVGREVAVKVILPGLANKPDFIRRFEAEAQLIARLEHMNIVPLHDYWRDPDGAYLVMRYLRGGSLHNRIQKDGAFSVEDTVNLFRQIGNGLHVAHRNQVIHRDIKPGNVLLDEDDNAYLADFGIAKDHMASDGITEPESFIGSPEYLAPEQARSEPVTPQTDIYSLGVVLYEMLAGEHPFPGLSKINYIYKHLNDPLPDIESLDDNVRDEINEVIQKATAKDPQLRFSDVMEMIQALQDATNLDASPTPTSLVELLTPREQEVMQLIIDGKTNREIADILVLAETTIKSYINNIYRKLKVRSRVQAIARVRDLDFLIKKPEGYQAGVSTGHLPEPDNPYKGLQSFNTADAQQFFGRDKLIQKLLTRLENDAPYKRFLAVVGPSGSGKSSVVKAGLIPAIWRGDLLGSEKWYIVDMLPGERPLDELEVALSRVAGEAKVNLREQLERDKHGLLRVADIILPDDGSELLIVIDQFEEVFTLLEDETQRLHFLSLLQEAVSANRSRVRVVITLRADYYDKPLQYPDFGELMRSRIETVLPPSAEELTQMIQKPAQQVGVEFEDGLVSRIVSDVHYQPGALPLLQYALTELFERRDERVLTQEAYQTIGGTGGALANRADELYHEGTPEYQELIRQMFLRLVTLGEGAEDTRRRVERTELLEISPDKEMMNDIIDVYAGSRLLSLDHDPATRQPTVEVAHEAILREWGRLRGWLNASREDIREERVLALAALAWVQNYQDTSYLLTGSRLEQANQWQKDTEIMMTNTLREYIRTSNQQEQRRSEVEQERLYREQAQEQRSQRLLRILAIVFALATILSGGFGMFAFDQRNNALEAQAEAETAELQAEVQAATLLSMQAEAELAQGNHDLAVLLAMEALTNFPYTSQAEHALSQAVSYNRALQIYTGHEGAVTSIAWSPDGTRFATSSTDNTVCIRDAVNGQVLLTINLPEGITGNLLDMGLAVKWTPDGRHLLTITGDRYTSGSQDFDIQLWDASNGEQLFDLELANTTEPEQGDTVATITHYTTGDAVNFAPESQRVATLAGDNTAIILDATLETQQLVLVGHENDVNGVYWSHDETRIATASEDGTVRIWDTVTGDTLNILESGSERITAVSWSPDDTQLVSVGLDGNILFWDTMSGQLEHSILGYAGAIWSVVWSPDSSQIITGHDDGRIHIWDVQSAQRIEILAGHTGLIAHLAWSPVGNQLASAGGNGSIRIWNMSPSTAYLSLPYPTSAYPTWSSDGQLIALAGGDVFGGSIPSFFAIWDVASGIPIIENIGAESGYDYWWEVEYSPDDTMLLARGSGLWPDIMPGLGRIEIIDTGTGEIIKSLSPPSMEEDEFLRDAQWSSDGTYVVASSSSGRIFIWVYESGELVQILEHGNFVNEVEWSPDGLQIVTGGADSVARVWSTLTWDEQFELTGHSPNSEVWSVEWSPDGSRILTTSGNDDLGATDTTARIWDSHTGEELLVITGHTRAVTWGSWSPDGRRVATVSTDDTTRVWDASTGNELLTLETPNDFVGFVNWSHDGQHLALSGFNTPAEIWNVWQSAEELIDYARDCCIFRDLTPEERLLFGLPEN